jgi:hypothetical protein
VETAIDRPGGDYRNFDIKDGESKAGDKDKSSEKRAEKAEDAEELCKAACSGDNKCRAWTFARPGYAGKEAHCFLKKEIKPPRRRAGYTSGVLR